MLDLSDTSLGYERVLAVVEALKHNVTLTVLNMSGVPVSDESALAIAKALKCNTTLTKLSMTQHLVDDVTSHSSVSCLYRDREYLWMKWQWQKEYKLSFFIK